MLSGRRRHVKNNKSAHKTTYIIRLYISFYICSYKIVTIKYCIIYNTINSVVTLVLENIWFLCLNISIFLDIFRIFR